MRRLFRILFNAAAVLSLVLCILTVALWMRSYRAIDQVIYQPTRDTYALFFSGKRRFSLIRLAGLINLRSHIGVDGTLSVTLT